MNEKRTLSAAHWGCWLAADASLHLCSADFWHWQAGSVVSLTHSVMAEKQRSMCIDYIVTPQDNDILTAHRHGGRAGIQHQRTLVIMSLFLSKSPSEYYKCQPFAWQNQNVIFTILTMVWRIPSITLWHPVSLNMHTTQLAITARDCALQRTHTERPNTPERPKMAAHLHLHQTSPVLEGFVTKSYSLGKETCKSHIILISR